MKFLNTTLIVPSKSSFLKLDLFFRHIVKWNCLPKEIILIETNKKKLNINKFFVNFCKKKKIILKILYKPNLYPGAARNIGIQFATFKILSFLDVGTFASPKWLQYGFRKINKNVFGIVWGKTFYVADSKKEKIIRASTYGVKPLSTLPGSTINKDIFNIAGIFLKSIRAGEDAEWIHRVGMHGIPTCLNKELIKYQNLKGVSYTSIIRKWFRNYGFTRELSYLNNNRENYFLALSILISIIAFNWNPLVAQWQEDSNFYIPHITKVSIFSIMIAYFFIRGFFLPIKKGCNLKFLLPFTVFKITFFSFFIDLSKLTTFIYSRFKNRE